MKILIAPNAFKHSLSATEVANAIKKGLIKSRLDCICENFPIGDGGDGTGELIIQHCNGIVLFEEVENPLNEMIEASYGLIDHGKTAVIEMASASGIRLLKPNELDPLNASTFGTGRLIKCALNQGVNKILLAVGGSATVDAGCGILAALGVRFYDANNEELSYHSSSLLTLSRIDCSEIDTRIFDCEIIILSDVENPLLGENGAAAVFSPQKGASPEEVLLLEKVLDNFAKVVFQLTGKQIANLRFGGAAGGVSAGLAGILNAKLVNGIDYFLKITGFEEVLKRNDLLITGEGSLDKQTLQGKGPFGVAVRAKTLNLPVIGLTGRVPLEDTEVLKLCFDTVFVIGNEPTELVKAIENTAENLTRTSEQIADLLLITHKK